MLFNKCYFLVNIVYIYNLLLKMSIGCFCQDSICCYPHTHITHFFYLFFFYKKKKKERKKKICKIVVNEITLNVL